jgi:NTE family protein
MMGFGDRAHIEDPKVVSRTIFVDSLGVTATDFVRVSNDPELREALFKSGVAAATAFLDGTADRPAWTFDRYLQEQSAP